MTALALLRALASSDCTLDPSTVNALGQPLGLEGEGLLTALNQLVEEGFVEADWGKPLTVTLKGREAVAEKVATRMQTNKFTTVSVFGPAQASAGDGSGNRVEAPAKGSLLSGLLGLGKKLLGGEE